MTRKHLPYWAARCTENTYIPEKVEYRKNSESHEYYLYPTRFPKMRSYSNGRPSKKTYHKVPLGWVDISKITGPAVRKIDDGYIRQRLLRNGMNISLNQSYITKIIENPRTPECNRRAAIKFVDDHPEYFIPRPTNTEDSQLNHHNRIVNGINPDDSFISRIKRISKEIQD